MKGRDIIWAKKIKGRTSRISRQHPIFERMVSEQFMGTGLFSWFSRSWVGSGRKIYFYTGQFI